MARPRKDPGTPETPDRLLDAALEEFARAGYGAASLADIAARAGIRRPSLLYHFESKQALYEAVTVRAFGRLAGVLEEAMSREGGFDARLQAVLEGYSRFLRDNPAVSRLVLREILDEEGQGRELLLERVVPLIDLAERFVREDARRGAPVRGAILQFVMGELTANALGSLSETLWRQDRSRSAEIFRSAVLAHPKEK